MLKKIVIPKKEIDRELAEEIALPSAFRAYSALLPILLRE